MSVVPVVTAVLSSVAIVVGNLTAASTATAALMAAAAVLCPVLSRAAATAGFTELAAIAAAALVVPGASKPESGDLSFFQELVPSQVCGFP